MSFIQALFLLGAAGVIGPIAAHLLARPRYRRVPFTMIRFLRTGETETQSRRQLKNLLVLLLRCAIIVLLALFFAGPERLLVTSDAAVTNRALIAVDDSLSMAYGDAMTRAIADATAAVRAAPSDARFDVYALASGATARDVDGPQAEAFIASLTAVPSKASLTTFVGAVRAASKSGAVTTAHIVSDFTPEVRAAVEAIGEPVPVEAYTYTCVGPETTPANAAITEVRAFPGTEGRIAVSAAVANYGVDAADLVLVGKIGDGAPVDTNVHLAGGETRTLQLRLPMPQNVEPYLPLELSISPQDGLPQDDHYFVGLAGTKSTASHVVVFGANNREMFLVKTALETLAQSNPLNGITVQTLTHVMLEPNVVRNASVLVLTSAPDRTVMGVDDIATFVRGGGRLIAFTNGDIKPTYYASLAKAGVFPGVPAAMSTVSLRLVGDFGSASMGDPLSPDGSAIRALRNYGLEHMPIEGAYTVRAVDGSQTLWAYNTGDGFITYKAAGNGLSILVNTSADDTLSPLMKSSAAVAFISYLLGSGLQLQQYAFDAGDTVRLPASDFELAHAQPDQSFFVETPDGNRATAQWMNQTITLPSFDELGWVRTTAAPVRYAGVNVPAGETDLATLSSARLDILMQRLFTTRESVAAQGPERERQQRKPVWPAIGWAALALIVLDVFVSNRITR